MAVAQTFTVPPNIFPVEKRVDLVWRGTQQEKQEGNEIFYFSL